MNMESIVKRLKYKKMKASQDFNKIFIFSCKRGRFWTAQLSTIITKIILHNNTITLSKRALSRHFT